MNIPRIRTMVTQTNNLGYYAELFNVDVLDDLSLTKRKGWNLFFNGSIQAVASSQNYFLVMTENKLYQVLSDLSLEYLTDLFPSRHLSCLFSDGRLYWSTSRQHGYVVSNKCFIVNASPIDSDFCVININGNGEVSSGVYGFCFTYTSNGIESAPTTVRYMNIVGGVSFYWREVFGVNEVNFYLGHDNNLYKMATFEMSDLNGYFTSKINVQNPQLDSIFSIDMKPSIIFSIINEQVYSAQRNIIHYSLSKNYYISNFANTISFNSLITNIKPIKKAIIVTTVTSIYLLRYLNNSFIKEKIIDAVVPIGGLVSNIQDYSMIELRHAKHPYLYVVSNLGLLGINGDGGLINLEPAFLFPNKRFVSSAFFNNEVHLTFFDA